VSDGELEDSLHSFQFYLDSSSSSEEDLKMTNKSSHSGSGFFSEDNTPELMLTEEEVQHEP
jgi:hypothetical protein